jgi:ketosteroid isomerase-like protein
VAGEDVELVRQLVQAFNRRNIAAMTQIFDPEIEWTPGGPAAVERDLYRGREQVSNGFVATWEAWELFHLEESEVRDLGDSILWLGHTQMRGGASRVELEQEFAILFRVRANKIFRIRGFLGWQKALEAAGPSE